MSSAISNAILTVSELTRQIKVLLESKFMAVHMKGEVTNLKEQSSGHLYFSLKDENAQIAAVLFKGTAKQLSHLPKSGDRVVIKGELSLYAPRGSYQIIVREISLDGVGDLLLKLHELKEKLKIKGYFNQESKKPLPRYPKTIGVITSPTGAVIQDILNILTRRFKGVHLILNPVKVQGDGAAKEIAQAIHDFNTFKLADVLIIGRGGGSLEDLWAFNEECVADAIFESHIPIISAVGHETDFSLSDFVADVRAPTPSAAAELVIKEASSELKTLSKASLHLDSLIREKLKQTKQACLSIQKHPLLSYVEDFLAPYQQRLDEAFLSFEQVSQRLLQVKSLNLHNLYKQLKQFRCDAILNRHSERQQHFSKQCFQLLNVQLAAKKLKLEHLKEKLDHALLFLISRIQNNFKRTCDLLSSINPDQVLKKGYCIPFAENSDSVIMSIDQIKVSQRLRLRFYTGTAYAQVTHVSPQK